MFRALTVKGIAVQDKIYDGTTAAKLIVNNLSLAGVMAGDQVTVSAPSPSGVFATKDVANSISVALTGLTLGGPQAFDYFIAPLAANITPATVQVSGLVAMDKAYDGTLTAALNLSGAMIAGIIAGDSITVTGAKGTFAIKDVGSSIPVTVTTITLGGPQAGDYMPQLPQQPLSAAITPAPLTVSGIVKDKVYDGTTSAVLTPATAALAGVFAGDSVTLIQNNPAAAFKSKQAGAQVPLTLIGVALDGPQAMDYTLLPTTFAAITPASVMIKGVVADDKPYDGTTAATVHTAGATPVGVIPNDDVQVAPSGATGTFAQKDVGKSIAVAVSGVTLTGAQAQDYTVVQPTTSANIISAQVTLSGISARSKTYDGTAIRIAQNRAVFPDHGKCAGR